MSDRHAGGSLFDAAAAEYDAARPSYPDELYAELEARTGPLAGLTAGGQLTPGGSATVGWTRQVAIGDWITDDRSKSYVIELAPAAREDLLAQLASIIGQRFPDGQMLVPYTTRLWLARKPGSPSP